MPSRIRAAAAVIGFLIVAGTAAVAAERGPYQQTVREIMGSPAAPRTGPSAPRPALAAPRRHLASNPGSPRAAASPAPAPSAGAPVSLAVGTSFLAATLADSDAFPPDTMGAAGPSQFLVAVNGRIRTFSKAAGTADGVLDTDLDAFFSSVRNGSPTGTPRVRYDRLSSRWLVTALNFAATNNRVLIAVTDAASSGVISNATVWTYYYFQHNLDAPSGDTDTFLDSASLGVDANALVIGGNVFDSNGLFQGVTVHVAQKSEVLAGTGGNLTVGGRARAFRNLTGTPTGAGPYSPQGVDDLLNAASLESWVAGVDNASFGTLVFRKIAYSAPGVWPPASISADLPLAVSATALPLPVPHLGNAAGPDGELDALDDRLAGASLRSGSIWTAHNVSVDGTGVSPGDRDGSRWYQVDVSSGTPALVQSGTVFDAASTDPRFYWMPSIAVSGQGRAVLGASSAGAAEPIQAAVAERLASTPPGSFNGPQPYTSTTAAYNPPGDPGPVRRWGDYSLTSVDPEDDMTLWTIQEFCNADDSWGVQVAQLVAPPPPRPVSPVPPSVAAGLASVLVDVSGTLDGDYFDPGPGFPRRIAASLGGGVAVNGVTYNGPKSLTLDLDTTLAAAGPYPIAVTNPDGQSNSSVFSILTITGSGEPPTVSSVEPTSGPASGGTSVELGGSGFAFSASIEFGGVAAPFASISSGVSAEATTPALPPGALHDVTVKISDTLEGTLPGGFFADFLDVPQDDIFHDDVETLIRSSVTAGCGGGNYCRDDAVTRGQMAVFLLKSKLGAAYAPPPCTGTVFLDVPCTGLFDAWIEDLAARGITGGCGSGNYCPLASATRGQMAALLLKTDLGSAYAPPACTGSVFLDVPCTGPFDAWIEDLAARGITGGCGGGNYCPVSPATRGQMAVLLVKTFELP